jgi:hypothetical protein
MRYFIFIISMVILSKIAQSQNYSTGLNFNQEAYDSLPILLPFTKSYPPAAYSLKDFAPIPANQGDIPSCVGWAAGYAALTMELAIKQNLADKKTITAQANSAMFIYNSIRENCKSELDMEAACKLLKDIGTCKKQSFEGNEDSTKCELTPTTEHLIEAKNFKIKSFNRLFDFFESKPERKIAAVKNQLAAKHPVIVGMQLTESFNKISGTTWHPNLNCPDSYPPIRIGGHAMCIVGYNDTLEKFELINSYGEKFGNNGFVYIKYKDFGEYCKTAYILEMDEEITPKGKAIEATFALEYPESFDDQNKIIYKEAKVQFDSTQNIYRTTGKWGIEDQYRLLSSNVTEGVYVYMFSVDAKDNINMHFPKMSCDSCKLLFGAKEAKVKPRNLSKNDQLIIPKDDGMVLELEYSGSDYACILYSRTPLPEDELCCRLQKIKTTEGSITQRLSAAFEGLLEETSNITYERNKMSVSTNNFKNSIIPIILDIKVE